MNALSWVCRRIWGYAILGTIAGAWFYGWRTGLPLGVLAYGILWCATWQPRRESLLYADFTHGGRDYTTQRLEIQAQENQRAYDRAVADAEAGLADPQQLYRTLAAENLRELRSMTPTELAARRVHSPDFLSTAVRPPKVTP